jgi:ribosomal protein L11 methyltransferase
VTIRTYLPLDAETETTRQHIEQALWHLGQMRPVGPLHVRALEEEDWANSWKRFYSVQRVGTRTVIVPSWLEYEPAPDEVVLHLDPGMAFGTGLHPTTQLCVRLLERFARPEVQMLDLGTGSGILAIAAAKLGAAPVLALDTDPVAVEVARENLTRNTVRGNVHATVGTLGTLALPFAMPPYDLVVANIIADVLIALAADLEVVLTPGGTLISSGIILDREDEVTLTYAAAGLTLRERHQQGDWVALVHTRY